MVQKYKILVKPIRAIDDMPAIVKGKTFTIDNEKLLCLEQHFYRMDMLPLHYCIAAFDKSLQECLTMWADDYDINEWWVVAMECKVIG
jgi:hypothetical protein